MYKNMLIMTTLTVRPRNKKELSAIKKILEVLKMDFESNNESPYNPEFVQRVLLAKEEIKQGKGVKIATEDLWK